MSPGDFTDLIRPGGGCICPNCGYELYHVSFIPCHTRRCPQCGSPLTDHQS